MCNSPTCTYIMHWSTRTVLPQQYRHCIWCNLQYCIYRIRTRWYYFFTCESRSTDTQPCGVVTISIHALSNTGLNITIWASPSCITHTAFLFVTVAMETAFSWAIIWYTMHNNKRKIMKSVKIRFSNRTTTYLLQHNFTISDFILFTSRESIFYMYLYTNNI